MNNWLSTVKSNLQSNTQNLNSIWFNSLTNEIRICNNSKLISEDIINPDYNLINKHKLITLV